VGGSGGYILTAS